MLYTFNPFLKVKVIYKPLAGQRKQQATLVRVNCPHRWDNLIAPNLLAPADIFIMSWVHESKYISKPMGRHLYLPPKFDSRNRICIKPN